MKNSILIFSLMLLLLKGWAQSPNFTWAKTYGGSNDEFVNDMKPTSDGGYILCGRARSNDFDVTSHFGSTNTEDFWVVKTSSDGTKQWTGNFGGTGVDIAKSVIQTSDGGYAVAGYTESTDGNATGNHGDRDMLVIKLDASGNLVWSSCFGGTSLDEAASIIEVGGGNFLVLGQAYSTNGQVTGNHSTGSDMWLIIVDSQGAFVDGACFGGTGGETGLSLISTSDGGYAMAGYARSNDGDVIGHKDNNDFWVVKLDENGDIVWSQCYGGYQSDIPNSIAETSDGGFIVAGKTISFGGDVSGFHYDGVTFRYDYWVIKLSSNGNLQWQKSLGGNGDEEAFSVIEALGGGYIVAGVSDSFGGDIQGIPHGFDEFWIVKLSASGGIVWEKSLGGGLNETATALAQLPNGSLAVAGCANSTDGQVTGLHGSSNGWDFWLVKLGADITAVKSIVSENIKLRAYPNPCQDYIHVSGFNPSENQEFEVINQMGKTIFSGKTENEKLIIKTDQFPVGQYIVRLSNGQIQYFNRF